jgi:hypothetical protein
MIKTNNCNNSLPIYSSTYVLVYLSEYVSFLGFVPEENVA